MWGPWGPIPANLIKRTNRGLEARLVANSCGSGYGSAKQRLWIKDPFRNSHIQWGLGWYGSGQKNITVNQILLFIKKNSNVKWSLSSFKIITPKVFHFFLKCFTLYQYPKHGFRIFYSEASQQSFKHHKNLHWIRICIRIPKIIYANSRVWEGEPYTLYQQQNS